MRKVAKLGIILFAGLIMFVIAYSFAFKGLSDRVIMLGLGIDLLTETGEYEVTAEVIVPGAGSSQEGGTGGSGSRLVRGKGQTVSLAVNDIYQHYGKTPSLGECSILVIGEDAAKNSDLRQLFGYFYASDAFKDGTVTLMCEGKASELFDVQTTMDSYVTFTLLSIVLNNSDTTTVPFTELHNIMEKQGTPSQCFYLNCIKTIETAGDSEKQDEQSEKPAVKLDASTLGVFKANRFAGVLSEEATRGMCLMTKPKIFDVFIVDAESESFYLPENHDDYDFASYDYVIDCIDTVAAKIDLVLEAQKAGTPIIASMGTGNKHHPELLEVSDIFKTSVCPLAKVIRYELKRRGVKKLKVIYSKEQPVKVSAPLENNARRCIPGSTAFVPASAGLLIASEVVKDIMM